MIYHWNDTVILDGEFRRNSDNALTDPTPEGPKPAAILRLKDPNGVISEYLYPDAIFSITSQGKWRATIEGPWLASTVELRYHYEWLGYGAARSGSEGIFSIAATAIPPP